MDSPRLLYCTPDPLPCCADRAGTLTLTRKASVMTSKKVTERDFRLPEFQDAVVEDYEFRGDGKVVRKDRWERAIRSICYAVGMQRNEFEVDDVVEAVRRLAAENNSWTEVGDEVPSTEQAYDILLLDGTVLQRAVYCAHETDNLAKGYWQWLSNTFSVEGVRSCRVHQDMPRNTSDGPNDECF